MKKINYIEYKDILYPDIHINVKHIGYYGRLKKEYMMKYQSKEYIEMMHEGILFSYLEMIDRQCGKRYNVLLEQYKKMRNITEDLKQANQLQWVQEMNDIDYTVKKLILYEFIYEDLE